MWRKGAHNSHSTNLLSVISFLMSTSTQIIAAASKVLYPHKRCTELVWSFGFYILEWMFVYWNWWKFEVEVRAETESRAHFGVGMD